jgi:hypothetical protein
MTTATTIKTIGVATYTSTPSNPHAAMLTKKSNSLHVSRATTRSQGLKPVVTLLEATTTMETSATFLQST